MATYTGSGGISGLTTLSGSGRRTLVVGAGAVEAQASVYSRMPYYVSDGDRTKLASLSQMFQVYVGFVPAYTPSITNVLRDADDHTHETMTWKPVVAMGPHRLVLKGEPVRFYAGNCYNSGGSGIRNTSKSFDWGDGTPDTACTGTETGMPGAEVWHTFASAGTYTVTLTVNDPTYGTAHGHRYVRVLNSWAEADLGVMEISGFSGSLTQTGWQCDLKLGGSVPTATVGDGQGVVMRLVSYTDWDPETGGALAPTGDSRDKSEVMLFSGYVVGDTVKWDADQSTVTFTVRTADYWLQKIWSYEQQFYNQGQSGYGHFVSGLTFAWVLNHMLCVHSNFAEYHDVTVWIDNNTVASITLGEGPLWNALTDFAKNEYGYVFSDRVGNIWALPDVRMRGVNWWGTWMSPPGTYFDDQNTLSVEVEELPANRVGFVRIEATNPFATTKTLTAKYPSSPSAAGEWVTESGIVQKSQTVLDDWAKRLWIWKNARYTAKVKAIHPLAMDIGGLTPLSYKNAVTGRIDLDTSVGGAGYKRPFYCTSASLNFDTEQMTFTMDLDFEDVPYLRYNESAARWEWYDDGSWYWIGTTVRW